MKNNLLNEYVNRLFIDESKIDMAVWKHLGLDNSEDSSNTNVTMCPYDGIWDAVNEAANNGSRIWVEMIYIIT